jgi:ADP-ribose pyrophosphatase YjhB (NUDIX family)
MRSASVPGSDGSGDHRDQDTGDRASAASMTISQTAPAASCVAPCAFATARDITGRLLLVRRCDTGDWELPGGHVDPGESASDAAVRETAEESGMTVEVTAWPSSCRKERRPCPAKTCAPPDSATLPAQINAAAAQGGPARLASPALLSLFSMTGRD